MLLEIVVFGDCGDFVGRFRYEDEPKQCNDEPQQNPIPRAFLCRPHSSTREPHIRLHTMVSDGARHRNFSMVTPALCIVASSLHIQPDASNAAHQKSTLPDAGQSPTSPRTPPLQFRTPGGLRASRHMTPPNPKVFRGQPVVRSEVTTSPNRALLGQSEGLSHGSGVAAKRAGRILTTPGLQLPEHDDDAVCCKPSPIPSGTFQSEQGPCLQPLRLPSLKQTVEQDIGDRGHVCCQLEQKVRLCLKYVHLPLTREN